jgi:hypothetical protein
VAKIVSDSRIGLIQPTESDDLRFLRPTEVSEGFRHFDISPREECMISANIWIVGELRPHQQPRQLRLHQPLMLHKRGANYHGWRNEVFADDNFCNLSGAKVVRILLSRDHIQIDDRSHLRSRGVSRPTSRPYLQELPSLPCRGEDIFSTGGASNSTTQLFIEHVRAVAGEEKMVEDVSGCALHVDPKRRCLIDTPCNRKCSTAFG